VQGNPILRKEGRLKKEYHALHAEKLLNVQHKIELMRETEERAADRSIYFNKETTISSKTRNVPTLSKNIEMFRFLAPISINSTPRDGRLPSLGQQSPVASPRKIKKKLQLITKPSNRAKERHKVPKVHDLIWDNVNFGEDFDEETAKIKNVLEDIRTRIESYKTKQINTSRTNISVSFIERSKQIVRDLTHSPKPKKILQAKYSLGSIAKLPKIQSSLAFSYQHTE
jgi:hypothetical protein